MHTREKIDRKRMRGGVIIEDYKFMTPMMACKLWTRAACFRASIANKAMWAFSSQRKGPHCLKSCWRGKAKNVFERK